MADEEPATEPVAEESVQPDRYVESDDFVPDPADQLGQVLTRGNINPADSLEYATPLFRQGRGGSAEDGGLTQDEYNLTPAQRAAAFTPDDDVEPGELLVGSPAATSGPVIVTPEDDEAAAKQDAANQQANTQA